MSGLTSRAAPVRSVEPMYGDRASRWAAVERRDARADGSFFFSVATTGVYCYPSCAARTPRPDNVAYHDTREQAQKAGFRPCKRCRPELPPKRERLGAAVTAACRLIEEAPRALKPAELAAQLGVGTRALQRHFKALTGITLKQYAMAHRARRVRDELAGKRSVTAAVYEAGYGSASRFYENSQALLGMPPASYARGGLGQTIRWDVAPSSLGLVLVAATERGVCALLFGASRRRLAADLATRFPRATLQQAEAGSDFSRWIDAALGQIEAPRAELGLPLDIVGTAFQQRVWQALRQIPPGRTTTYGEIAKRIGHPRAVRAVGAACGANPVAVLIPCHRVLAADGSLGGYRWGEKRKRALLAREASR
jgi:AraC family transcriptional regulator, regulatory protein of adaptative response / methylated-DNA-[protein]-cysteine methyltransferase